ncbi:hypothetical protein SMSP2_02646 [Limihaloglobus sulfuriphilus]|uniref:Uncharacterized protein n=1 Tax=Limihaloglobus sulfuriphilus TaxID=1851148 RepID=A0A1Q2MHX9_9BACT|nr:hypothetical protein [Limihaloglobus sulfuriphilus]AQQ72264.1 hypothetical protein SMSP2_02646 [Limihaloglobus sulfuriphilus]
MSGDCFRDYIDYMIFSLWWLEKDCGKCGGADLNGDSCVLLDDLADFANGWLIQL